MIKKIILFITLIFAFTTLFINRIDEIKLINVTNTTLQLEDPFQKLGYTHDDLKTLQTMLNEHQINQITIDQIPRNALFPYLKFKTFKFDAFYDYEQIRLTKKLSVLETINTYNHPFLMSKFYEQVQESLNIDNNLILVNKNYYLNNEYIPRELVFPEKLHLLIPNEITRNLIKKETYEALFVLSEDAKKRGLYLYLSNGYRSYERQDRIYNEYIIEGSDADTYSARAGHSEHQTGLAVDLTAKSVQFLLVEEFAYTKEGQFVINNAHKYGFIIRYPKDKEHLTGYKYEPWHLRYVGKEVAEIIKKEDLTLEEYLLKYTELPIIKN